MTGIIIVVLALVVGFGYHYVSGKNDAPVEEFAERVIEQETGSNIDLSPGKDPDIKSN